MSISSLNDWDFLYFIFSLSFQNTKRFFFLTSQILSASSDSASLYPLPPTSRGHPTVRSCARNLPRPVSAHPSTTARYTTPIDRLSHRPRARLLPQSVPDHRYIQLIDDSYNIEEEIFVSFFTKFLCNFLIFLRSCSCNSLFFPRSDMCSYSL